MPEAQEIFLRAKREEEENLQLCGKGYQENAFVFKWPEGTSFSPDYVSSHFTLLLKNNGLPHIRFHELSHSCTSLLLNSGFTLEDVQEYMGHSDIQMTANTLWPSRRTEKAAFDRKMAANIFYNGIEGR